MIRCGHCKQSHSSVAEVRACATGSAPRLVATPSPELLAALEEEAAARPSRLGAGLGARPSARDLVVTPEFRRPVSDFAPVAPMVIPDFLSDVATVDPSSEKQQKYITDLLVQRDYEAAGITAPTNVLTLSRQDASDLIGRLLKAPKRTAVAASAPALPDVAAGRYAITAKSDGHVVFYQVDRPTEGQYAGRTYVKQLIGAPGAWRKERLAFAASRDVLERIIEAGVEESARLFGRKTETCGHCSSPLSTLQSRASGYGETCAAKHGYWYASESEARRILGE